MAITNICGFETGGSDELSQALSGTSSIQTSVTAGTWSRYALRCNPVTTATGFGNVSRTLLATGLPNASTTSTFSVRFAFRAATLPASGVEELLTTATIGSLQLRVGPDGLIKIHDGNSDPSPTLLGTSSQAISTGTWYQLSLRYNSTSWEFAIDGVIRASGSATLSGVVSELFFGKVANRNGNSVDFYYDDIVIQAYTDGLPPLGRCVCLLPRFNGTYTAWTEPSGLPPSYLHVDELPPDGATSYNKTSTNLNRFSVLVDSTTTAGITGTVNAVKSVVVGTDASTTVNWAIGLRSNTTDSAYTTAADSPVAGTYQTRAKLYTTDPATSAAWVTSAIDSVQPIVQHQQSTSRELRCTWMGVMVDYTPAAASSFAPPPFHRSFRTFRRIG